MKDYILNKNVSMLKANGICPGKLKQGSVPVDIDVTPFDNSNSSKEGQFLFPANLE